MVQILQQLVIASLLLSLLGFASAQVFEVTEYYSGSECTGSFMNSFVSAAPTTSCVPLCQTTLLGFSFKKLCVQKYSPPISSYHKTTKYRDRICSQVHVASYEKVEEYYPLGCYKDLAGSSLSKCNGTHVITASCDTNCATCSNFYYRPENGCFVIDVINESTNTTCINFAPKKHLNMLLGLLVLFVVMVL